MPNREQEAGQLNRSEDRVGILTSRRSLLILGLTTIAAAVLRLHLLGAQSLWIDEAASAYFVKLPLGSFLKTLWGYQGNMTLYYFLLRAWVHLGYSEFTIRSLSVLFGVLAVPAIYVLGSRLFDRATGLTAAAFLAVHSFHIGWSKEARSYSLLILLLILTAYFLVRALESARQESFWFAFSVAAALSFYSHIYALLVLVAYGLTLVRPRPFRVDIRALAMAALLFALLCEPLAAFVLKSIVTRSDQINWIMPPTRAEFFGFLELLSGGGIVLILVYFSMSVVALATRVGHTPDEAERWALRLLVLWLVFPPLLMLAATPVKPLFHPGFMLMCVPPLVILAARGIVKLYHAPTYARMVGAAAFVLVITFSLGSIARPPKYPYTVHADWRSAINYILQHQQPGDGAVFFIPNIYPYRYYCERAAKTDSITSSPDVLYPGVPLNEDELRQVTNGRKRVWLIMHLALPVPGVAGHPREVSLIQSTLADTFQLVDKRVFPGEGPITVALYSRQQPLP